MTTSKFSTSDRSEYKSELQNSVHLRTVLAFYGQETDRNKGKPNYSQLKTAVKLRIDQMVRNRNFRVRNDAAELILDLLFLQTDSPFQLGIMDDFVQC